MAEQASQRRADMIQISDSIGALTNLLSIGGRPSVLLSQERRSMAEQAGQRRNDRRRLAAHLRQLAAGGLVAGPARGYAGGGDGAAGHHGIRRTGANAVPGAS